MATFRGTRVKPKPAVRTLQDLNEKNADLRRRQEALERRVCELEELWDKHRPSGRK